MMENGLKIVLIAGMVLMCIPISLQMKRHNVALWKSIPVSVTLILTGIYGSSFWFYLENGHPGGRSLYGVLFLVPLVIYPVAKLFRIPYGYALDYLAPSGCLTLAAVKVQCLVLKCCEGMVLYIDNNGRYVRFPSQLVEMAAFLVVSAILFWMSGMREFERKIFPWALVLYGGTRFFLNLLREETAPFLLGLTAGCFWSVCAVSIGIVWLISAKRKKE